MEKKYWFALGLGVIGIGVIYYYREDLMTAVSYTQQKEAIKDFSKKKIKSKAVDIHIQNLNEL